MEQDNKKGSTDTKQAQTASAAKTILFIIYKKLRDAVTDLLPIILVIAFFQIVVIRQPLPVTAA